MGKITSESTHTIDGFLNNGFSHSPTKMGIGKFTEIEFQLGSSFPYIRLLAKLINQAVI